jgi:hypothetical protein
VTDWLQEVAAKVGAPEGRNAFDVHTGTREREEDVVTAAEVRTHDHRRVDDGLNAEIEALEKALRAVRPQR